MSEVWTRWERHVINGAFPLRRLLSSTDHSAVFLTECKAQNLADAAIKLVPANPALADAQLASWKSAAALFHRHLIRILDAGRCQLGPHALLFVVMEYAEETLSEILPQRALTPDEARQMLPPVLEALQFLHRRNLVHGQLKPGNVLVVQDQLKLASDGIRAAGRPRASSGHSSPYDPPEGKNGAIIAAGDTWALGVTLVEALTQRRPTWSDEAAEIALPANLPGEFAPILRRCLSRTAASRPTAADLEAWVTGKPPAPLILTPPPAPVISTPPPAAAETVRRPPLVEEEPKRRPSAALLATFVALMVAAWACVHLFRSHLSTPPTADSAAQISSQDAGQVSSQDAGRAVPAPAVPAPAAPAPAAPDAAVPPERAAIQTERAAPLAEHTATAPEHTVRTEPADPASRPSDQTTRSARASARVLHEEVPDVPRSARETIRGRIKVAVRVTVDSSGAVVDRTFQNPGPSRYFARLATEAARKWKFAPVEDQSARQWLLDFEFTRAGATARAITPRT